MVFLFLFGFFLVSASEGDGGLRRSASQKWTAPADESSVSSVIKKTMPDGTVLVTQSDVEWRKDKQGRCFLLEQLLFDVRNNAHVTLPSGDLGIVSLASFPVNNDNHVLIYKDVKIHFYKSQGYWNQMIPISKQSITGKEMTKYFLKFTK